MRLEEFGLHLRELELIEIFARWGVFPMLSEFSLFAASLQDVSTFFHFPICIYTALGIDELN